MKPTEHFSHTVKVRKKPIPPEPDQQELDAFLHTVGNRVRQARQRRGMSGRVLSRNSGVSLRYISLLENGKGNISITLLYKVAAALGHQIDWLLGSEDPWCSDAAQPKQKRLCLIGLRGAGKSTLGKSLSDSLSLPFIEINAEIEVLSGMSVAELISLYGQEGYRKLEHQAIEHIVKNQDEVVMTAAGGVVSDSATFDFLLKNFHTVWLKATPEEHMQRVKNQGDSRPMAGNPEAMAELKSILTNRERLYEKADRQLDTSGRTLTESCAELLTISRQLLRQRR